MHLLRTSIFLGFMTFMFVGCADAIIGALAETVIDDVSNEETKADTSGDTLKLFKIDDGFSIAWDKIDDEYNEIIYRDAANDIREAIMIGSTPQLRQYLCLFEEKNDDTITYICTGTGTPTLGDSSATGTVTITFKEGVEYAFFVDGENITNILVYTRGELYISTP